MKNEIKNYIIESKSFLIKSFIFYFLSSVAIIFYGRGGMFFTSMIVMFAFLLLFFFLIEATAILVIALFSNQKKFLIYKSINCFVLMALVLGLIFPFTISEMIGSYECQKAKSFCEQLAPKLDAVKDKTGKYPTDIFVIVKGEELPIVLKRQHKFYSSDGNLFKFEIRNDSSLMSGWIFSSEKREWEQWN